MMELKVHGTDGRASVKSVNWRRVKPKNGM